MLAFIVNVNNAHSNYCNITNIVPVFTSRHEKSWTTGQNKNPAQNMQEENP